MFDKKNYLKKLKQIEKGEKMKRILLLIVIMFLFISCVTTNTLISPEISQQIPKKATKIILNSNAPADSLFKEIYKTLVIEGYGINNSNNEMLSISTNEKDVGGDTFLRINAFVESIGSTSKATFTGQWKYGSATQSFQQALVGYSTNPSWQSAMWLESHSKYSIAFAGIVKVVNKVNYAKIEYEQ